MKSVKYGVLFTLIVSVAFWFGLGMHSFVVGLLAAVLMLFMVLLIHLSMIW